MNRVALLLLAACTMGGLVSAGRSAAQNQAKPYVVQDDKVDSHVYNGYRRYGESCLRCHGPDGAGSSYAPSLVDSLKSMSEQQFDEVVVNGKQDVNQASDKVMPAFGTVEDVVIYLKDIYAYLKARSDGALGRGRPVRIGDDAG